MTALHVFSNGFWESGTWVKYLELNWLLVASWSGAVLHVLEGITALHVNSNGFWESSAWVQVLKSDHWLLVASWSRTVLHVLEGITALHEFFNRFWESCTWVKLNEHICDFKINNYNLLNILALYTNQF